MTAPRMTLVDFRYTQLMRAYRCVFKGLPPDLFYYTHHSPASAEFQNIVRDLEMF
jgi:hypothetical protein